MKRRRLRDPPISHYIFDIPKYNEGKWKILEPFTLTVSEKSWIMLLGASGVGKTTLLRLMSSLLPGATVPTQNKIAYMSQEATLLPWLSVIKNIALPDIIKGKNINKTIAENIIKKVGLLGYENHFPRELSTGMKQRVNLARILYMERPIILLDEPFSSVDAITRESLYDLCFQALKNKTVIMVTHDIREAIRLGSDIYILKGEPAKLISNKKLTHELADMQRPRKEGVDRLEKIFWAMI